MKNLLRHRPWLWIVLVLALQLGAWTAWLTLASRHRVAEVPLQTAPGRAGPLGPPERKPDGPAVRPYLTTPALKADR